MISGTALFLGLFNNLAIFIVLVAVYGVLNSHFEKSALLTRQAVVGFSFGLFAIGCMYVKIHVAEGVIVDQRNTVVALSGAFGGPLSALVCAVMTGAYRIYLGGAGILGGVIGVCLAAAAGIIFYKLRDQIDSVLKASVSALAATIIILPGFLFFEDLQTGWELLKAMALPYGFAIFLGIFLVGLLLAHEEHRHIAEAAQKKSEKRFRELFENLVDVSYRTDIDGNFIVISPSSEKIFGYRPEEVLGRQIANAYRNPSRRDDFMAQIRRDGQVENFEAEMRKKDGSFIWVSTNAKLLTNAEGSFIGIEGVARDISQLKKSEEEKLNLEESLRQSQKMEAIGTLAGGIAHDFNNILAAIIGYSEIAIDEVPEFSPARQSIREVLNAAMRAKELVRHILTFSRKSEQNYAPVQIQLIVKDALKLLRASIPATIDIRQDIDSQCGTIIADPTELHQVTMNLCTNAAQEMEKTDGVLYVSLERLDLSEDDLQNEPTLKPGPHVKLSVKDTGLAIDSDHIDRIFDPYYTTKDVGMGSGLGLAVVHGIVKRHNGMITVETNPTQGTTFNVFFPIAEGVEQQVAKEIDPLPTGNERILVVDDETSVVEVTQQRLERLGYQVTSKNSSIEALELFRAQPNAFELIITDQTMPDMTGEQLAKKLIDLRPDILIVLCTGYSSNIDAEKSKALGIKEFILKPIDLQELAITIRRVLDAQN
jgi:two-component system cell cycle sensor histidine kinase/response regulator CckA